MRIVIIEGHAVNPGDLSWAPVAEQGELTVYPRTLSSEIISHCREAEIILSNKVPFTAERFDELRRLRLICVMATGYNIIDTAAAAAHGVTVCNVPGYGTASVAQHTFALLLELMNHVGLHSESVARGEWLHSPDWAYAKTPLTELKGKTIGIFGLGNIGSQTARIARAFGMEVLYNSPTPRENDLATFCDAQTLFRSSDVVSLHCPLTPENREFVNAEALRHFKPSAVLINTARGQLIHEGALAAALNNGQLAGAALDVLSTEPPQSGNPLLAAKNCIITPHNAWMSREARERIIQITRKNIEAFVSGEPINVVNNPATIKS